MDPGEAQSVGDYIEGTEGEDYIEGTMREEFTPPREATMYRRVMKERDFLEKVSYVGIFTGVSKRELCALQTICISDQGNTQMAESFAERKRPDGISLHPRTIFAYLCASVTRSISNMTSSSTVGYSGSFFPISCSIRWYNSTSYLQKNKKGFLMTLPTKRSCLSRPNGYFVKRAKVTLASLCCVHWQ